MGRVIIALQPIVEMKMQTLIAQRKRLLLKLDTEYKLFLEDLKRERARLAEIDCSREARRARGRKQRAARRMLEASNG
jgi:hypothetical protein